MLLTIFTTTTREKEKVHTLTIYCLQDSTNKKVHESFIAEITNILLGLCLLLYKGAWTKNVVKGTSVNQVMQNLWEYFKVL